MDISTPLNKLAAQIHATAISKGWWGDLSDYAVEYPLEPSISSLANGRNFGEVIALIHSEASEALEEYRNGHGINEVYYTHEDQKPEGVPSELADTIIRVLDACAAYGIDIDKAIKEKMSYNESRPARHGGKRM